MIPQELMNGNDEQFFQRNKNREGPIWAHHFQMKSQFISEVSRILTSLFAGKNIGSKRGHRWEFGGSISLWTPGNPSWYARMKSMISTFFFSQIEKNKPCWFQMQMGYLRLRRCGFFWLKTFFWRIFVPPSIRRDFLCGACSAHLGALPWRSGRHVQGVWRCVKCRGLGDWPCGIEPVNSWANWGRMLLWKGI